MSREIKFTDTKWRVVHGWNPDGSNRGPYKRFPTVVMLAKDDTSDSLHRGITITMNMSHNQQIESIMANAYLVSAAPDMFHTLDQTIDEIGIFDKKCREAEYTDTGEVWVLLERIVKEFKLALAKAEGETLE